MSADLRSALWRRIRDDGLAVVAVMGMSKNTGKTVALNHLLACAAAERVAVGLTSIGRDGEASDAVFSIPKPPLCVWPGTLVATARGTLARSGVRTRRLGGTGIASPLGEIELVQVLEAGEMEVAGASRNHDQQRAIELLRQAGAAQVFLDGALGRSHHASPALADGVVLATGGALGGGIGDVLRKTRERLALLSIRELDGALRERCRALFEGDDDSTGRAPAAGTDRGTGRGIGRGTWSGTRSGTWSGMTTDTSAGQGVALWAADGTLLWQAPIPSLDAGARLLEHDCAEVAIVGAGGAVGRRLWPALLTLAERHPGLFVLVADGTRLFVESADLAALAARGGAVRAWRRIRLAGITVNPFARQGSPLDAAALLAAAREAFVPHAVTDVVLESNPSSLLAHGPAAA